MGVSLVRSAIITRVSAQTGNRQRSNDLQHDDSRRENLNFDGRYILCNFRKTRCLLEKIKMSHEAKTVTFSEFHKSFTA